MGHEFAGYVKEKVFLLERTDGKVVLPNFSTVWHFESKIAQSYLFDLLNVSTPRTVVSFDYDEALELARRECFPVVQKETGRRRQHQCKGPVQPRCPQAPSRKHFQPFPRGTGARTSRAGRKGSRKGNLSSLVLGFCTAKAPSFRSLGVAYWQEFIPGNNSDLRITAIGDKRFRNGFLETQQTGRLPGQRQREHRFRNAPSRRGTEMLPRHQQKA